MTKAVFALIALVALAVPAAVATPAGARDSLTGNPMADARIRAHGILLPGSEAWQNARRKALEKRYPAPPERRAEIPQPQRSQPLYLKLTRGNPTVRTVALTFDDGPHPEFTPDLLAVLDRYNVKATFFVVGKMAERYPDLVRREVAAGHEIGNHTYHHVNVARLTEADAAAEWRAGEAAIMAITGERVKYCRPPGGRYDRAAVVAASGVGLTTVLWTDNSADYLGLSPRRIEQRVLSRISNGGIILMHDGVRQTIEVLPEIIEKLRGKGYRLVTVSDLERQRRAR